MYCSECGSKAAGKFCWSCGAKLRSIGEAPPASDAEVAGGRTTSDEPFDLVFEEDSRAKPATAPAADWAHELNYEWLLAIPEIRARIADAGRRHRPGVTGEQFLAVFDALVPTGISVEKLCVALQPIYGRLGIKIGKSSEQSFAAPVGRVLVAALCSLAANGHELRHVEQAGDGCALQTDIPSSLWALAGELVVSFQRRPHETLVSASATVTGQMYDWGHSRRVLDRVFDGIRQELAAWPTTSGERTIRPAA